MIQLEGVHKSYIDGDRELHVLRGISLEVAPGEVVALTGSSGSGKSTLLNLVGAMDQDYTGRVVVAGQELQVLGDRELSAFRNTTVSFVFQHFHLLGHLPALANVMMPAYFDPRAPVEAARGRATSLLERVGLGDRLDARPGQLSGGERQRVAIARALVNRPRLLLADEPTGALDSTHGDQVLSVLESLSRDEGVTVVIVSHDPAVSARCDREVRIVDGVLLDSGEGP